MFNDPKKLDTTAQNGTMPHLNYQQQLLRKGLIWFLIGLYTKPLFKFGEEKCVKCIF